MRLASPFILIFLGSISFANAKPWTFTNGSASGYSLETISAAPKPGTPVCAGSTVEVSIDASYTLTLKDEGVVALVFQDERNTLLNPERPQKTKTVPRGSGRVSMSDSVIIPSNANELLVYLPLTPTGLLVSEGELVFRYPIQKCSIFRAQPSQQVQAKGRSNAARLPVPVVGVKDQMRYHCGTEVLLGDIVVTPLPDGRESARVVMLGENYNHLDINASFVEWVKKDRILKPDCVVIEWLNRNPFTHNDPRYAPVGNFMFVGVDEDLDFQQRASI